jgi:hypothetical protein
VIRLWATFGVFLSAGLLLADELPLPQQVPAPQPSQEGNLEKPTVVIKPPVTGLIVVPEAPPQMRVVDEDAFEKREKAILDLEQRVIEQQLRQKIAAAHAAGNASLLKQIIIMGGPMDVAVSRAEKPPTVKGGQVALIGLEKNAKVSKSLEQFFGAPMTPASEKELLDTVKSQLAGKGKANLDVRIAGWWPDEGVMAVSVVPGS